MGRVEDYFLRILPPERLREDADKLDSIAASARDSAIRNAGHAAEWSDPRFIGMAGMDLELARETRAEADRLRRLADLPPTALRAAAVWAEGKEAKRAQREKERADRRARRRA